MEFKASLGKNMVIFTIVILLIILLSAIPLFLLIDGITTFKVCFATCMLLVILISWGYRTNSYKIEHNEIVIERPFGNKRIPMKSVTETQKIDARDLRYSIRTFGNGGLFGNYGKFFNKKFGNMTWYATNLNNAVLLKTDAGKKIIVTPDDHEKFLQEIAYSQRIT